MKRSSQKESSNAFPYNPRDESKEDVNSGNLETSEATQLSSSFQLGHEICLEACS